MRKDSAQGHPDHDACGVGFIVRLGDRGSHEVVERALAALQRLTHRGGVDADGCSGDGAGLLTAIPHEFIRRVAGIPLPSDFGLGMLFLPAGEESRVRRTLGTLAPEMGLECLGWREVPVNTSVPGSRAAETLPSIWQCFLGSADPGCDLEKQLFLLRKRAEAEPRESVYFASLSSRTVVYKGLLSPWQLPLFYPDLLAHDFASPFAIFHQRFSTNTRPAWPLAQPFRFLAHNGEINTIVGNRRWMRARERDIRGAFEAGDWFRCLEDNVSDSASVDNALEVLVRQGWTPEAAMLALVPPVHEAGSQMSPRVRKYLESTACEYEPWDGPAALVFSDGRVVGAKLDRNGLRPMRYARTSDGWMVAGSEAGVAEFDPNKIIERQRLGPGEMLVVDIVSGAVARTGDLLRRISAQSASMRSRRAVSLPEVWGTEAAVAEPERIAAAVGWSADQVRHLLEPLAAGKEAIWSMGDDTPPAFMSNMKLRRTVWDYCKQRFAQVTNPPIDSLREAHVMSLRTWLGPDFVFDSPVLAEKQLAFLEDRLQPCLKIDLTYKSSRGLYGAYQAFERIRLEARCGTRPRMVVLSDRGLSSERTALPVLLATAAVWQERVRAGNFRVPLVVETAQAFDTHHVALLLAVGATAVSPFLSFQLAEARVANSSPNYCRALCAGLKKVLSRMGISTLDSYRNAQLFEVVGLDARLCREFFEDASRCAEAASLETVLENYLHNHALAFDDGHQGLRDAGYFRYRKDGEIHNSSPELLRKLQASVKTGDEDHYREFEEIGSSREPTAVRDLLAIVFPGSAGAGNVESESELLRRFSTQAMSVGAVSPEVHRTLALAMNRLGARSNTGEGGEDPELYSKEPEAACRIKQVASGRFGVTAEYLVHAREIEIKMAQGSKPGEGGQLPAVKVTPYIARLRRAVPGMSLISPPPHHDIYSIEDLEQLIHDLREVNPDARIGVKLVAGAGVGIIAAGVAKAGADVITISGHDGGTGASPLSSIKNTGLPWEFGLRDAHHTLSAAGLRQHVRLRVDGGLKFARDVIIAAMFGADEFGFGTAALLAIGCVMARQCHLNTCPVGIATQDETLRARFTGKPEMVISYFRAVASEVRALLARLGVQSLEEVVGQTSFLRPRYRADSAWVEDLLRPPSHFKTSPGIERETHGLARELTALSNNSLMPLKGNFPIINADRSIGARLSGGMLRRFDAPAPPAPPPQSGQNRPGLGAPASESSLADLNFHGAAGPSFGAFLTTGITLRLFGEANDYVGKGLSGGVISIDAGPEASLRGDVLAGNTVLYGATSGELYIAGTAGERFAVRNSGALAVVEGLGEHGCEYMTGGVVVVLGATGINFGSGMTGGLAYLPKESLPNCNQEFVHFAGCSAKEEQFLRRVLVKHCLMTGSPRAASLLNSEARLAMVRVQPKQLPCSVEQTWSPIAERLPASVVTAEIPVFALTQPDPMVQPILHDSHRDAATDLDQPAPG
jgi:glutamate synthase domain-containing protein 2/glutamate synthase domain-containing protein 1/glutamate synthase domain-containing protein 3